MTPSPSYSPRHPRVALLAVFLTTWCCCNTLSAQDLKGRVLRIKSLRPEGLASSPQAKPFGLKREDVTILKNILPKIQDIVPIREIPARTLRAGERTFDADLVGTTHSYLRGKPLGITHGRFLTQTDSSEHNNVTVLHAKIAAKLFPNQNPLGKTVRVDSDYFTVVGIVDGESPPQAFIPLATMRTRFGDTLVLRKAGRFEIQQYELTAIEIVLFANNQLAPTANLANQSLKKIHPENDFQIETPQ